MNIIEPSWLQSDGPDRGELEVNEATDRDLPWPSEDADLTGTGNDWWLVACMDWPRDRWLGYVLGYRRAAGLIVHHVAEAGRGQDTLVYPFLMCWRHCLELQLKVNAQLLQSWLRVPSEVQRTHKLDVLWRKVRPLIERAFKNGSAADLDNAERIILQLKAFDPTSEHFRYPISSDGTDTLRAFARVHLGRFHDAMEGVANLLDGVDAGVREMLSARLEREMETHLCFGE